MLVDPRRVTRLCESSHLESDYELRLFELFIGADDVVDDDNHDWRHNEPVLNFTSKLGTLVKSSLVLAMTQAESFECGTRVI